MKSRRLQMPDQPADALAFEMGRAGVEMIERALPAHPLDERTGIAEDEQPMTGPGQRTRQVGRVFPERHAAVGVAAGQAQNEHIASALPPKRTCAACLDMSALCQ